MTTPKPLRQGRLDYLCGVYAVINAVRLTLADPADFRSTDCRWLFQALVRDLGRAGVITDLMIDGQNQTHVRLCLRLAQTHVSHRYPATFAYAVPFHGRSIVPRRHFLAAIRDHLKHPSRAAVLRLSQHWSVVRRVSPTALVLFDSWGVERIALRECAIGAARDDRRGDPWVLQPSSLFLLDPAIPDSSRLLPPQGARRHESRATPPRRRRS